MKSLNESKRKINIVEQKTDAMDPPSNINGRHMAWLIIKKLDMDDVDRTLMEFDDMCFWKVAIL